MQRNGRIARDQTDFMAAHPRTIFAPLSVKYPAQSNPPWGSLVTATDSLRLRVFAVKEGYAAFTAKTQRREGIGRNEGRLLPPGNLPIEPSRPFKCSEASPARTG